MKIAAALLVAFVAVPALRAIEAQPALPLVQTFDAAWSIIDTTYYDPTFRGLDWNAVRAELRPEAERAKTPAELRATIAKMLARLGESHFAVLPQFADDSGEDSLDRSGAPGFDVRPDFEARPEVHALLVRAKPASGRAIASPPSAASPSRRSSRAFRRRSSRACAPCRSGAPR